MVPEFSSSLTSLHWAHDLTKLGWCILEKKVGKKLQWPNVGSQRWPNDKSLVGPSLGHEEIVIWVHVWIFSEFRVISQIWEVTTAKRMTIDLYCQRCIDYVDILLAVPPLGGLQSWGALQRGPIIGLYIYISSFIIQMTNRSCRHEQNERLNNDHNVCWLVKLV